MASSVQGGFDMLPAAAKADDVQGAVEAGVEEKKFDKEAAV